MKARFDHQQLALRIMEDGDIDGAMRHILDITKDDNPQRRRSVFDNIRTKILKQENYRCPNGYQQLQQLARRDDFNPSDKIKLEVLLSKPLHFLRWSQVCKTFFSDFNLQQEWRSIRIVKDPFYEFDCPEKIKVLVQQDITSQVKENHNHNRKPREHYNFSEEEVDDMVKQATDFIHSNNNWNIRSNSLRLLECMSLLTGRRKWELCSTLRIKSTEESIYQAMVQGLGKNIQHQMGSPDQIWERIPLLAPIDTIVKGITNVRLYCHQSGSYTGAKKLFPKMTHTHYRNVYADKAYVEREKNKFRDGDSCSMLEWKRSALMINMNTFADRYSTMVIHPTDTTSDEPVMQQREQDLLANQDC